MKECIDTLGDATILLALDANSGYWQVKTVKDYRNKRVFISHHGLFRLARMPFRLERTQGRFKEDGRLTYEIQVAACPCLFRRRRNIFKNAKRAYRPRNTIFDGITRHRYDIKPEER